MLEIILFLLLGCIIGTATGIAPGIHPNTVVLGIPLIISLMPGIGIYAIIAMIVSMSVVNAIVDFVPSVLLGAPDPSVALSVLPGHRMLVEGRGYRAIKLSVMGCILAVLIVTMLSPLFAIALPFIYNVIRQWIAYILVFVMILVILLSKKYLPTILIILLSGMLGIVSMQLPIFKDLGNMALFPLLTGLFGLPTLITQIRQKALLPEQFMDKNEKLLTKLNIFSAFVGSIAGVFSGLLPGLGASQAAMLTSPRAESESFLVRMSAVSTSNIILSFMALWLIARPRSGAAVAVQQLVSSFGMNEFLFILPIMLISAIVGGLVAMFLAKWLIRNISKINYSRLSMIIIILLNVLIAILTGPAGLVLAWLATTLGLISIKMNVIRSSMMASLMIPTTLFYMGVLA